MKSGKRRQGGLSPFSLAYSVKIPPQIYTGVKTINKPSSQTHAARCSQKARQQRREKLDQGKLVAVSDQKQKRRGLAEAYAAGGLCVEQPKGQNCRKIHAVGKTPLGVTSQTAKSGKPICWAGSWLLETDERLDRCWNIWKRAALAPARWMPSWIVFIELMQKLGLLSVTKRRKKTRSKV